MGILVISKVLGIILAPYIRYSSKWGEKSPISWGLYSGKETEGINDYSKRLQKWGKTSLDKWYSTTERLFFFIF